MAKWTVNCLTLLFLISFVRSLAPSRCWLQGTCGGEDSFFTGRERLELWSNTSKRMLWYFGGTWTKVQEITVYFVMKQRVIAPFLPKTVSNEAWRGLCLTCFSFPILIFSAVKKMMISIQMDHRWKWNYFQTFIFFSFRNILEHCLNCYGEITDMDSDTG